MNRDFIYKILKEGCESKEKGCEFSNSLILILGTVVTVSFKGIFLHRVIYSSQKKMFNVNVTILVIE